MRNSSSYRGIKQSISAAIQSPSSSIVDTLWMETTHTIENIITPKNIQQIEKAVEMMIGASTIHFLGLRSSRMAADYLESTIGRFYRRPDS